MLYFLFPSLVIVYRLSQRIAMFVCMNVCMYVCMYVCMTRNKSFFGVLNFGMSVTMWSAILRNVEFFFSNLSPIFINTIHSVSFGRMSG